VRLGIYFQQTLK
ncbi:hypothetical protein VCHENC02_4814B, partial [Vibrio harveyi]